MPGEQEPEHAFPSLATLEELISLGQSLTAAQPLPSLLVKITQSAKDVLAADLVVLYEYLEESEDVRVPPVICGPLLDPPALRGRSIHRPHRASVVFKMLRRSQPFYAANAAEDWPAHLGVPVDPGSFIHREGIVSSAAAPLIAEGRSLGVLFINYRRPFPFDKSSRQAIELFALQAAVALWNARLLARERSQREQAETLQRVAMEISSTTGLITTAGRILDELGQVVPFKKATMQLVQDDQRSLLAFRGFAAGEVDPWLLRPISGDPLIERVVQARRPLILPHPAQDPAWEDRPPTHDVHSWIGVPLVFQDRVVGLLTLDHDQPGYYTASMEEVLVTFGNQAAIAVENARLLEMAQRRIHDLEILNQVAEIMSSRLRPEDLLKTIVERIRLHLDCTHCTIFFPQEIEGETCLVVREVAGKEAEQIRSRRFKPGEGLAWYVFEKGEPLLLMDARKHPRYAAARQNPEKERSMLVVPIQESGRTVGVISADQDVYGKFNTSDLSLLQALARQAGIALQRYSGIELLQEISSGINSAQGVDQILERIVEGAIALTHVTSGVIYLIGKDGRSIARRYQWPKNSLHPAPRMDLKTGLTRQIIAKKKVMLFPRLQEDKNVNPALYPQVRSMIGLPLLYDQQVTGVLYLNDAREHDFSETEVSLLQSLANQAATALHKASLLASQSRLVSRHLALNQVGVQLTGMRDETRILKLVARSAARTLPCNYCLVFRVEGSQLVVRAAHGEVTPQLAPGAAFPLGDGVAGWAAETGKALLVADTLKDPHFNPAWSSRPPRSLIAAPIWLGERVVGVVSAEHQQPAAFDKQDLRLLQSFALQVSQALGIARHIHDLEALNQAGQALNRELEPGPLVNTLLKTVGATLHSSSACLFVAAEDGRLVPTFSPESAQPTGAEERLAEWVARSKATLSVPDAAQDPRAGEPRPTPRLGVANESLIRSPLALLQAPLVLQERVIGVLSAGKEGGAWFGENDQRLLENLASQAAVAYENARLFRETRQQARELSLLREVSSSLLTLDLNQLLLRIVAGAMALTGSEIGIIYLFSEDGRRITTSVGLPQNFLPERFDISSSGWTRYIYEHGEPVVVYDTTQDSRVSAQVAAEGIRSFIGQPLKVGPRVTGVLYLNDKERHRYTPSEQELVATLASQAAAAIENARLYEQRTKYTYSMVQAISSISTENDPLPTILKEISRVFPEYGSFAQVNPDTQQLVFRALWEKDRFRYGDQVPPSKRLRSWQSGITGWVARHGEPYRAGNVSADPYYQRWRKATLSELVVPIKTEDGRVLGILNFESALLDAFSQADQELAQDIANLTLLALEKERLYRDLERRARHLEVLRRIAGQVGPHMDRQEIFATVVNEARLTLAATRCTLFVFDHTGTLVPKATSNLEPRAVRRLRFRLGEGLAGWVAQEGRPVLVADANQDDRFLPDSLSRPGVTRSMVLAPLWVEGKIEGVLSADRDGGEPFDDDDQRFLEILAVQSGIFILRRQRLEAVQRRFNPYVVGGPIRDPHGFFGRRELLQRILDGIHNNHYIIHGERRIGKTSVLYQLEYHLNRLTLEDPQEVFFPVLVSLQGVEENLFFSFLARRLQMAVVGKPEIPEDRPYTALDLEDEIGRLLEILGRGYPGRQIHLVLLLDEMDQFAHYSSLTHGQFRRMFTSRRGRSVHMVMAGVAIQQIQTLTSPWYNLFQILKLSPLDEIEARDLITVPVSGYYTYPPETIRLLLEASDLKPLELQRLSLLTINALLARVLAAAEAQERPVEPDETGVRLDDVRQALDQALCEKDGDYHDFWEALDSRQQQFLCACAQAGGDLDLPALFGPGAPTVDQTRLQTVTCLVAGVTRLTFLFRAWLKGKCA